MRDIVREQFKFIIAGFVVGLILLVSPKIFWPNVGFDPMLGFFIDVFSRTGPLGLFLAGFIYALSVGVALSTVYIVFLVYRKKEVSSLLLLKKYIAFCFGVYLCFVLVLLQAFSSFHLPA